MNNNSLFRDTEKVQRIIKTLGIKVLPRDQRSKDPRTLLSAIFSQWLPLSASALLAVVEQLPSPVEAQAERVAHILHRTTPNDTPDVSKLSETERAICACNTTADAPTVAFVTKMLSIPVELLPENKRRPMTAEEMRARGRELREARQAAAAAAAAASVDQQEPTAVNDTEHISIGPTRETVAKLEPETPTGEVLVGYARVFSGRLRLGQKMRVLGPKYDPSRPDRHVSEITITALYMLMGRDLEPLPEVPAGNVCGIGGLAGVVLKTATLSDVADCPSLGVLHGQVRLDLLLTHRSLYVNNTAF